jgi:hypothetical protein
MIWIEPCRLIHPFLFSSSALTLMILTGLPASVALAETLLGQNPQVSYDGIWILLFLALLFESFAYLPRTNSPKSARLYSRRPQSLSSDLAMAVAVV